MDHSSEPTRHAAQRNDATSEDRGARSLRIEVADEPNPQDERVAELMAHTIDVPALATAVQQQAAADAADILEDLDDERAAELLELMDNKSAAAVLTEMETPLARIVVMDLLDEDKAERIASILCLMAPDDAVELLRIVDSSSSEKILSFVPLQVATGLRNLLGYDPETAGGVMTTDYRTLRDHAPLAQAIEQLRQQQMPEEQRILPVVDNENRLVGLFRIRDLLFNDPSGIIEDSMKCTVHAVRPETDREEVARQFGRYDFSMLPVVDGQDRLLGVITIDDVLETLREEQTEDVQKLVGAGREEAVYSSVVDKMRGRLPWLIASLIFMIPAAYVVLEFEGLIKELALLAVLMPVAAAGNAGHQALAVTLRGLVLDEVRRGRVWPLLRRELTVGLLAGIGLGSLVGLAVWALSSVVPGASVQLGIVALCAMTLSMTVGTLAGTSIPLVMHKVGADPAQASAIILIMITDAVAFLSLLGISFALHMWLIGYPSQ